MSRDRTLLRSKVNADRKVVETVEEIIAICKREFGINWQDAFLRLVTIRLDS